MTLDADQLRHHLMAVIGVRAPIAGAAVLQLIEELRRLDVLDDEAVGRIKDAVVHAAIDTRPAHWHRAESEAEVRHQLDRLFDASRSRIEELG